MQANRYQDLRAWRRAIELVGKVYSVTAKLPQEEMFGLKSQMRRCAASIPSNIAEGQGRATRGEFQQFLGHGRGSLYELETQIVIAARLGYVEPANRDCLLAECRELGRLVKALIASLKRPASHRELTTDN
ncbi:MAG TPA: four helix bundle protein [Terriglobales bacterium]|jgi:four helix bundle protein|nr:four helix bundle protein [Terriglobales bacterium]